MKSLFFAFIFSSIFLLFSCEDDDCNCNPTNDDTIIGMWERTVTDNANLTFGVYILFKENGEYAFLLAENAEGHTNSYANYTIDGNTITIINDSDCTGDGVYSYTINGDQLTLTADSENCAPREFMLAATWTKVE